MAERASRLLLGLFVTLAACQPGPPEEVSTAPPRIEAHEPSPTPAIDEALLAAMLAEAVVLSPEPTGDRAEADGLLVRLAFEPLLRQSGPSSVEPVADRGYRLAGVGEGSALWALGLRDGDLLTSVDGEPILGRELALRSLWDSRPARVEIGYRRGEDDRRLRLQIRPGAAWPSRAADPLPTTDLELSPVEFDADGIVCAEPTKDAPATIVCRIERTAVDALLANPAGLAREARVVPAQKDGETVGFKLYAIRPDTLFARLQLKNGDLVRSVGGQALDDIDAALAAYEALRDAKEFELALEREGEPMTLRIVIAGD